METTAAGFFRLASVVCLAFVLALASPRVQAAAACTAGQWTANPDDTDMPAVRYETEHFAFRWKDGLDVSQDRVASAGKELEQIWNTYLGRIGFPEPYCSSQKKYKVSVFLDDSFGLNGGVADSGGMGMWINPNQLEYHWGLAHELTHALQGSTDGLRDSPYVGWIWESHAEWMAHQYLHDNLGCSEMLVNYPHLYLGSTRDRYCNWQFMEYLKDRFGYAIINDLWAKAPKPGDSRQADADPFSIIRDNMGWSQSQLNDVLGQWAMHNVTWDYTDPDGRDHGALMRQGYGSNTAFDPERPSDADNGDRALRLTRLDPVQGQAGSYQVPFDWAPQRWGYNLVRLVPAQGADTVVVRFHGNVQQTSAVDTLPGLANDPETIGTPDSDWRWGLVAVDANGKPRYSALQQGAEASLSFQVSDSDTGLYLVVMGTPSKMQKIKWDQSYYSIYRYPWRITLENAYPSGLQPDAPTPTRVGSRHPNGGGWVAQNAYVASTAYVGPNAQVLAGKVLGDARIEDHATILGGEVRDDAVVGGLSLLQDGVTIADRAQLHTVFKASGAFGGFSLSSSAQLRGDVEQRGASASKGVFYGYVDAETVTNPDYGADLTDAVPEVTATPR